eukprot:TRINITY_DN5796_c3_g1_i1.p1 TRINITY_DN5796_c3_g1~~TRINITY_DN5796_c3_g1_i1.p1  ORF type:complete len:413 (+),score=204.19 TRINITY_DN5796_c3_g1_i1:56-1240(+)
MPSFEAKENGDLNQYWFGPNTIDAFVNEIEAQSVQGAAFLSSPSLYFSLRDEALKAKSKVFEFDKQWESDPGFVFYDYNKPDQVSIALFGQFDMVVIDPPFITEECWRSYTETARLLLCPGGKLICTTIVENEGIMQELLGCTPVTFRPSIPNLVYQYNTYTSYHPTRFLDVVNPEIAADDANPAKEIQRSMLESREQFISMAQNRPGREHEAPIPVHRAMKNTWDHVPEGLQEFPSEQPEAKPVSYGPEHDATVERRAKIGEASKLIDRSCRPLDKIWREKKALAKLESATGEDAEAKRKKHTQELERAFETNRSDLAELRVFLEVFPEREHGSVGAIVEAAVELLSCGDTVTEEDFKKIGPDVLQKFKSPLFNHQKALLVKIKELKKQVQAA